MANPIGPLQAGKELAHGEHILPFGASTHEDLFVARPGIAIQLPHRFDLSSPKGIEMDISNRHPHVGIPRNNPGLVSVLEKMANAFVSLVEVHGITRQEASHERRQFPSPPSYKKVKMIRHQRPGEAGYFPSLKVETHPFLELLTVLVVMKDISFFDSAAINMMACAREIDPGSPGHERKRFNNYATTPSQEDCGRAQPIWTSGPLHGTGILRNVPVLGSNVGLSGDYYPAVPDQTAFRKKSKVRERPSGNGTVGSYPNRSLAREMSARESRTSPGRGGSKRGGTRRPASS